MVSRIDLLHLADPADVQLRPIPAIAAADAARAAGTDIFGIHFGTGGSCPNQPENGIAFMRDEISSGLGFFFEGGVGDLSGIFQAISESVTCDDGDPCTLDFL